MGRLFISLGLALVFGSACKEGAESDLNAIVDQSTGNALALIPMRHVIEDSAVSKKNLVFQQNYLRISLGIVQCAGQDGASNIGALEKAAQRDQNAVTHRGPAVLLLGKPTDCSLRGAYKFSAPAFVKLFLDEAASQEDFELQQSVWLAMRGKGGGAGGFKTGFAAFLYESLGAVPAVGEQEMTESLEAVDQVYDPCDGTKAAKFSKFKAFRCTEQGDYAPAASFQKVVANLQRYNETATREFLSDIKKMNADGRTQMFGYQEGIMVAPNLQASVAPKGDSSRIGTPEDIAGKIHPLSSMVGPMSGKISDVFGLAIMNQLPVPRVTLFKKLLPSVDGPALTEEEGFFLNTGTAAPAATPAAAIDYGKYQNTWAKNSSGQWQYWNQSTGTMTTATQSNGAWNYAHWQGNSRVGWNQTGATQYVRAQNSSGAASGWYRAQLQPRQDGTYDYSRLQNSYYQNGARNVSYYPASSVGTDGKVTNTANTLSWYPARANETSGGWRTAAQTAVAEKADTGLWSRFTNWWSGTP